VADLGLALRRIAGRDPRDSTSAAAEVPDFIGGSGSPLKSLRLGIPREYFPPGLDPEIAGAVRAALQQAEELGARVEEVSLPHTDYAIPTYYIIATAEASSNLAR
jgi:aspartyl-tRNA(Asn)/glutamyl-tRNA(Gln) amidotransferase subunit A